MTILGKRFRIAGTRAGMAIIEETGECTENEIDSSLRDYETGRMVILPVPRQTGLIAKLLDTNSSPTLQTVGDDQIGGSRPNCIQLGKTEVFQIAPVQNSGGALNGSRVLGYRRMWQQLSES